MLQALRILVACGLVPLASASGWSYGNQGAWSGQCGTGTEQSPIDIITANVVMSDSDASGAVRPVELSYGAITSYKAANNGHTYQVTLSADSVPSNTMVGSLTPDGSNYNLAQIHVHWGEPGTNKGSEHLIDGEQYAMEMHFVHFKDSYADTGAALASGERDALAVFGVLFKLAEDGAAANPALDQYLAYAGDVIESGASVDVVAEDKPIDIAKLVPSGYLASSSRRSSEEGGPLGNNFRDPQPINNRTVYQYVSDSEDFYAYMGSLTTPDCNEQVVWTVANPEVEPMYITREQLDKLYALRAGTHAAASEGHGAHASEAASTDTEISDAGESTATETSDETPTDEAASLTLTDEPTATETSEESLSTDTEVSEEVAANDAAASHHWTYDDQAAWPGECGTGTEQTPINIDTKTAVEAGADSGVASVPLSLSYAPVKHWKIHNNGHTVQLTVPEDQQADNTLTGGRLGEAYKLWQFHMHWGSEEDMLVGSEHTINDKRYSLELHLVHYKGKYATAAEALASGDRDALSVVGVMYELDDTAGPNPSLEQFFRHVADVSYAGEAVENITTPFDLTGLVPKEYLASGDRRREGHAEEPAHIIDNFRDLQPLNDRTVYWFQTEGQSFFAYDGSLTTPDCNEQVTWNVINPEPHPMAITTEQLEKLYALWATPKPAGDEEKPESHRRAANLPLAQGDELEHAAGFAYLAAGSVLAVVAAVGVAVSVSSARSRKQSDRELA